MFMFRRKMPGYEDWASDILGPGPEASADEWEVVERIGPGDKRLGSCKGWIMGACVGTPDVDHPCIVFLTEYAIYADVHPQTLGASPEVIVAPLYSIGKCGLGANDVGGTRMVIVFDSTGQPLSLDGPEPDPSRFRAIGVDLPRGQVGESFGRQLMTLVPPERQEHV